MAAARKLIWQTFWKRAGDGSMVVRLADEDAETFAMRTLNGRILLLVLCLLHLKRVKGLRRYMLILFLILLRVRRKL